MTTAIVENEALLRDLLAWVGESSRPYPEVMDAWRTSCPRLTVWEDAVDRGYLSREATEINGQRTTMVLATQTGRAYLAENGRPS